MRQVTSLLVVALAVLLAGCGQAVEAPAAAPLASGEIFQIALPRIVIDIDRDGNPSILGIGPNLLAAFGLDVSGLRLPPATVDQVMSAKIQHLEIASIGDRLLLLANGKPLPHLGWSEDSLNRALLFAGVFDPEGSLSAYTQLVPLVTRLGLDAVLRFPQASGEAEIPLADVSSIRSYAPQAAAEPVSLIIKFEVRFDEAGKPGLMGLSPQDLALLGLGSIGQLDAKTISQFQRSNIQHMELRTTPDGAHIYVNGEPLPTLIWDSDSLASLSEVLVALAPNGGLLPLFEKIVPYVDRADIGILIHLPAASGQQPIPAQMH